MNKLCISDEDRHITQIQVRLRCTILLSINKKDHFSIIFLAHYSII